MSTLMLKSRYIGLWLKSIVLWFDSYSITDAVDASNKSIDWLRVAPFVLMHLACFAVFFVGWSYTAVILAFALYFIRMFAITAFYHRYFSHRAFKTSRLLQFIFAALASSAGQRGPLWWASHHRQHHASADQDSDQHSPSKHGLLWSHMGWFLAKNNFSTRQDRIKDFVKYPELIFLDRFDIIMPLILAVIIYLTGVLLESYMPSLGTNGMQLLVWGFFVSTVMLYHGTFTINSLAHTIGRQVFPSKDDSRNNLFLAIITMGEGWHNNHHYYPGSARQGFMWWEIDMTFYGLLLLEKTGLIWDLRKVPAHVYKKRMS